ncbi:hypothetical protein EIP86_002173 [Pleurotus ostreatoroseus]|nr:hypothetical protein EIP86_002173 [Pleurotus ostreatoroseus]
MAALANFTPADCKATLKSKKHHDYPHSMRYLTVTVTHPQLGKIADLQAVLIDRSAMPQGEFLGMMDDESDDLQKLALGVFDLEARVKDSIVHDEHHRGTGCWGPELDDGRILYISTVQVDEPYRRKGVGTLALGTLQKSRFVRRKDFLAAWPFPPPGGHVSMYSTAVDFFHKNGFRRIGRTQFFAYSPNPSHPSRRVLATEDAPDESSFAPPVETEDDMDVDAYGPTPYESKQLFPLHYAIARSTGPPSDYSQSLMPRPPPSAVVEIINNFYATDPTSVVRRDEDGFTPLHVAAKVFSVAAIRALLALPAVSQVQATATARDAKQGLTPLDIVERKMEAERAFKSGFGVPFVGHDVDAMRCVYLLKKAAGVQLWTEKERNSALLHLDRLTEREKEDRFVELHRFGCSCSQCVGWLSPRMLFRLACAAEQLFGMIYLCPTDPEFTPAGILKSDFFEDTIGMDHIPLNLRRNATKTWFKGYHSLFSLIYDMFAVLQDPANPHALPTQVSTEHPAVGYTLPNPATLLEFARIATLPSDIHFPEPDDADVRTLLDRDYLVHGGLVEYALDAVVHLAKEQCPRPIGDGTFDDDRAAPDDPLSRQEAWAALPTCKNDLAWDLVRENMGIGETGPAHGPYLDPSIQPASGLTWEEEQERIVSELYKKFPFMRRT